LATFNGQLYLPELLQSLASQTCRPSKVVLRDDGSSDDSVEIVKRWATAENIPLQTLLGERLGPAQSFLRALEAAEATDIYLFADQDDVWLPMKIERALGHIHYGTSAPPTLYASRLAVVDEQLHFIKFTQHPNELSFNSATCENVLTGCTMAFNSAFRSIILQKLPKQIAMHDWWLYLLATATATLLFDDTPTILYRQHSQNIVGIESTGLFNFQERINRFRKNKSIRSNHLRELLSTHENMLNPRALELTNNLLNAQTKMSARFFTALTARIKRQTILSQVFTRFAILINRF
jgi:glycosyltransferase involved in cell wall biosynthesis